MALKRRMAVTLPASPFIKDTVERVQWAEANGYTDAWFGDGGAPDALTAAALLGAATHEIRIGVAVTPVYTRTPAVLVGCNPGRNSWRRSCAPRPLTAPDGALE